MYLLFVRIHRGAFQYIYLLEILIRSIIFPSQSSKIQYLDAVIFIFRFHNLILKSEFCSYSYSSSPRKIARNFEMTSPGEVINIIMRQSLGDPQLVSVAHSLQNTFIFLAS